MKSVLVVGPAFEASELITRLREQGYDACSLADVAAHPEQYRPRSAILPLDTPDNDENSEPHAVGSGTGGRELKRVLRVIAGGAGFEAPAASLVGSSEPIARLRAQLVQLASKPRAAVLVRGETGYR